MQSSSYPAEYIDESPQFHQSESEEVKYGKEMPIVREESISSTNKLKEHLSPTLIREESEDAPPAQPLNRIESTISAGGPQNWEMLGNFKPNF